MYGNLHETHGDRHVTVSNIPLMFYQFWGFYNLSLRLLFTPAISSPFPSDRDSQPAWLLFVVCFGFALTRMNVHFQRLTVYFLSFLLRRQHLTLCFVTYIEWHISLLVSICVWPYKVLFFLCLHSLVIWDDKCCEISWNDVLRTATTTEWNWWPIENRRPEWIWKANK